MHVFPIFRGVDSLSFAKDEEGQQNDSQIVRLLYLLCKKVQIPVEKAFRPRENSSKGFKV